MVCINSVQKEQINVSLQCILLDQIYYSTETTTVNLLSEFYYTYVASYIHLYYVMNLTILLY